MKGGDVGVCDNYANKFRDEAAQKIEEKTTDYIEKTCNNYTDTEKTDCEKVLINDQTKVTKIMTKILNDPEFLEEEKGELKDDFKK